MKINDAERIIGSELGIGEYLLWSGRPVQRILLRSADIFLIPLSVLYISFILYPWIAFGSDGIHSAGTLVFLFYILFGRFMLDGYVRANTFLGVTSKRAIILYNGILPRTRSVSLEKPGSISFKEGRRGRGTIYFGGDSALSWLTQPISPLTNAFAVWNPYFALCFEGIEDAWTVYSMIMDIRRASNSLHSLPASQSMGKRN